jgi:hypothetical protein
MNESASTTSYSVTVTTSGGTHAVSITTGAGWKTSTGGTLAVDVSAAGVVTAAH